MHTGALLRGALPRQVPGAAPRQSAYSLQDATAEDTLRGAGCTLPQMAIHQPGLYLEPVTVVVGQGALPLKVAGGVLLAGVVAPGYVREGRRELRADIIKLRGREQRARAEA